MCMTSNTLSTSLWKIKTTQKGCGGNRRREGKERGEGGGMEGKEGERGEQSGGEEG